MRVKILNRRYDLRFVRTRAYDGECDPPTKANKEIRIRNSLKGEKRLDAVIHECLHAAGWHLDEEFIGEFASDLARILTKLDNG